MSGRSVRRVRCAGTACLRPELTLATRAPSWMNGCENMRKSFVTLFALFTTACKSEGANVVSRGSQLGARGATRYSMLRRTVAALAAPSFELRFGGGACFFGAMRALATARRSAPRAKPSVCPLRRHVEV
eukprot:1369914-Prymnesium_polylepis.1